MWYSQEMPGWRVNDEIIYPSGNNPFNNRFYGYRDVHLTLPDGRLATYHGVVVPPCVHIVAVENDGTSYLVRQDRPNVMEPGAREVPQTLELPGGFARPELSLEGSAQGELAQEIGKSAGTLVKVGVLFPSHGISSERDTIFLGTDLEDFRTASDEATEQDLSVVSGPFGELYDALRQETMNGNPISAQTFAAMSLAAHLL
jgi:hypothetical protein